VQRLREDQRGDVRGGQRRGRRAGELPQRGTHDVRVGHRETLQRDVARPRHVRDHQLLDGQVGAPRERFPPQLAAPGQFLQALDRGPAHLLVPAQRVTEIGFAGDGVDQRDRVLHGQLGAGADGEVGGVRGVAQQHRAAGAPTGAAHGAEPGPPRAVADQGVTPQVLAEQLGQERQRCRVGRVAGRVRSGGVEPGAPPGLLVSLDEERAALRRIRVGMGHERAELGFRRGEHRVVDGQLSAAPHEQAATDVAVGAEVARLTGRAADAIRRDDQVRVQLVDRTPATELQPDTHLLRMPLQHRQQLRARHADQVVAVHPDEPIADLQGHVMRPSECQDVVQRLRVGSLEVALGACPQSDTEAERGVRLALLVHGDLTARLREPEQARGIEPSRTCAEYRDAIAPHGSPPAWFD
jgi:hypothetical protein